MPNLKELNRSMETSRLWVKELMQTMGTSDEGLAYRALRFTLGELRDHLPLEEVADLGAQLPLFIRGLMYEGWSPGRKSPLHRSKSDFLGQVAEHFKEYTHIGEVEGMVRNVFAFIEGKVSQGEIRHVTQCLPKEIRELWPSVSERRLA